MTFVAMDYIDIPVIFTISTQTIGASMQKFLSYVGIVNNESVDFSTIFWMASREDWFVSIKKVLFCLV